MYALADCNNFFVSCERALQPQLEGKPVVVLSNNDGCVVARSNEAKAMGIKMGTPFFKVKDLVDKGLLTVRSSNYTLYGDLSSRVMSILSGAVPRIEVYSIDEAFLIIEGMDMTIIPGLCHDLVFKIRKWTGIPVSIGIAETKTLAKLASHFAKKYKGYHGVCVIDTPEKREKALSLTPVGDIWGVGFRMAPKLERCGILTALDLVRRPKSWIEKTMSITGVRTWMELQGIDAVADQDRERRQSICTSRSFADMISDGKELSLRVSDFAAMCASKLRREHSAAYKISTFAWTNSFRQDLAQYYPTGTIHLPVASSNTPEIVQAALRALRMIYKPGFQYKRAGVTVSDIIDAGDIQAALFDFDQDLRDKQDAISRVMDSVNSSGRQLLRMATQRPGHYADGIRRDYCSGLYSTSWTDLIKVH